MILDTNAVSALFSGDEALKQILESSFRHHLPVIVLGEYRFGVLGSKNRDLLTDLLETLEGESHILPVDAITTRHYAEIRRQLKKAGTPIPENDVWIAALAKQHMLSIVSRDRHFDLVESIQCIHW